MKTEMTGSYNRFDSKINDIDLQLLIVADYFKIDHEELLSFDQFKNANNENLKTAMFVIKELKTKSLDELIEIKKVDKNLLLEYILQFHHTFIRKTIPEISKVWKKYNELNLPKMANCETIDLLFNDMTNELLKHLEDEEQYLIPIFNQVEDGVLQPNKELINYILVATSDHDETMGMTNEIMRKIDQIEDEAINPILKTYMNSITKFIENLYEHIYIEKEILFPYYRELILNK